MYHMTRTRTHFTHFTEKTISGKYTNMKKKRSMVCRDQNKQHAFLNLIITCSLYKFSKPGTSLMALSCNVIFSQWCPSCNCWMWRTQVHLSLSDYFSLFFSVCLYFCLSLSFSLHVSSLYLLQFIMRGQTELLRLSALFFLAIFSHVSLSERMCSILKKCCLLRLH